LVSLGSEEACFTSSNIAASCGLEETREGDCVSSVGLSAGFIGLLCMTGGGGKGAIVGLADCRGGGGGGGSDT